MGVLVFAGRSNRDQTRVSLLDSADIGRGRALTVSWPPADQWLTEPMIGQHGVFVATADAVHGLAFHGYESFGQPVDWRPPEGQICAAAIFDDGRPHVAVADADGGLSIWSGNGQTGEWHRRWTCNVPLETGAPVLFGPFPGLPGRIADNFVWLLAGGGLYVLDANSGERLLSFDAKAAAPRSHLVSQRLGAGQQDPVVFGTKNGETRLALTLGDGGLAIQALRSTSALRRVGDISPTGWAIPDPSGHGLLVGDKSRLRIFANIDLMSEHEMKGILLSQMPVVIGRTMIAMAERQTRLGGTPEAELVVLELPAINPTSAGDIRILLREPLIGAPAAGLPPLLAGSNLLLALEGARGDVDVHSLRVHEPTGTGP